MKVYIMTDLEEVAGVVDFEQTYGNRKVKSRILCTFILGVSLF